MRDNNRDNAYTHTRSWEPITLTQHELGAAQAAKDGSKRLREAMLAYYRKYHSEKAA